MCTLLDVMQAPKIWLMQCASLLTLSWGAQMMPDVRVILMFRNPTLRVISQYTHLDSRQKINASLTSLEDLWLKKNGVQLGPLLSHSEYLGFVHTITHLH